MKLRRDDTCSVCGGFTPSGDQAWWNSSERTVTCTECIDKSTRSDAVPVSAEANTAGGSAQREYERRRATHDQALEERWGTGRIGTIAKTLVAEPQSTTAWAKGADGERRLSNHLRRELKTNASILDDRQIPGTRANIDHIAVTPSGIWIVDAKNYKGKVELRSKGSWGNRTRALYVGGRDRTRLIGGMAKQHDATRHALDSIGHSTVPIHLAICFTNADWPLIGGAGTIDHVWIGYAQALVKLIRSTQAIANLDAAAIAGDLAQVLPPA